MRFASSRFASVVVVLTATLVAPVAWAATNGAGSLFVSGAGGNPTHWDIPIGVQTTAEIRGVDPAEVGGSLPATLTVWVKSSQFGNTMLTATRIGLTADYTFTYTPPAVANGDLFDACGTTIVAYYELGLNSNNDLRDDGLQNGSANAASGFRFVDSNGDPIECEEVGVEAAPWSQVKTHYR
jgi:hypothetical protein